MGSQCGQSVVSQWSVSVQSVCSQCPISVQSAVGVQPLYSQCAVNMQSMSGQSVASQHTFIFIPSLYTTIPTLPTAHLLVGLQLDAASHLWKSVEAKMRGGPNIGLTAGEINFGVSAADNLRVWSRQNSVLRFNCLDSLDRTTVSSFFLALRQALLFTEA